MPPEWSDAEWEPLGRYVSGTGDESEREALERWVSADPDLRSVADAMRSAGRGTAPPLAEAELASAWKNLQHMMARTAPRDLRLMRSAGELGERGTSWRRPVMWAGAVAHI